MKKLFIPFILWMSIALTGCYRDGIFIDPSGLRITETRDIRNFDGVEVYGNLEVRLVQASQAKVVIEGDENIVQQIETYVTNNVLQVRMKNGYSSRGNDILIWVHAPDVYEITLNGSGEIITENLHNFGDYLEVTLNGSGYMFIRGDARTAEVRSTGSGDIRLTGNGRYIKATANGSGDILAGGFTVDEADAKVWGSGDIFVNVWRYLYAEINGSGDIIYEGNPRIEAYRTGSGTIRRR